MVASASTWVKFFIAAGIPSSTAAKYAHVFYENRIQMDMLIDLNKEYLREMSINPMGDIIAILRHAKMVYEENAREKVLFQESESKQTPSPVSTSPVPNSTNNLENNINRSTLSRTVKIDSSNEMSNIAGLLGKPPRRVLPEHEGGYKITLPTGTTKRSQEILAKKALLYSDNDNKKGVFDRLQMPQTSTTTSSAEKSLPNRNNDNNCVTSTWSQSVNTISCRTEPMVKITGLDKPISSVFARLGGKGGNEEEIINLDKSRTVSGILKNSTTKQSTSLIGIMKKPKLKSQQQKVILVKKQPAKAATMVADDYEHNNIERMETGEKSVSFSSEDEVLEFTPRKLPPKQRITPSLHGGGGNSGGPKQLAIKDRLGFRTKSPDAMLHRTRKIITMKSSSSGSGGGSGGAGGGGRPIITRSISTNDNSQKNGIKIKAITTQSSLPSRKVSSIKNRLNLSNTNGKQIISLKKSTSSLSSGRPSSSSSSSSSPSLTSRSTTTTTTIKSMEKQIIGNSKNNHRESVTSVFQRLGFNS